MPAPRNMFKLALSEGRPQIGLWLALANSYTAEICGGAGFDWLLIDGEHAPNDVPLMMAQLQALSGSTSHPIIRPPIGEAWLIKQLLDLGAQTLLVPMVETGEQARALVRAVRYPPHGMRGVGAALARASAFNRIDDYLPTANAEICCCCRWKAVRDWRHWTILRRPKGSMASSSVRRIWRPTWASLAGPGHPRCRRRSRLHSRAYSRTARLPAS